MDPRRDRGGPDLIDGAGTPALSIVIPVYNEGENVVPTLRGVVERTATRDRSRCSSCYDFDEDTTVPVVKRLQAEMPELRLHRNTLGRGVLNAMKSGLRAARAPVRPGHDGRRLRRRRTTSTRCTSWRRGGADVVAGSRYMRGGRQIGGPLLKRTMSRAAGLSLHWLGGVPVHDATSNFRLYSKRLLNQVTIESTGGFELGIELTVKAHLLGHARGGGADDLARPHRRHRAGFSCGSGCRAT